MDMRLQHTEMMPEVYSQVVRSQINVEGEVPIAGSLRETTHVLYPTAMAVVERTEPMQDRASITGRVIFCVLYTQGDKTKVESIEATAEFSHLCDLPGATGRSEVFACAQAEHVEARVQNGRMTMRAAVKLQVRSSLCEPVEAVVGVDAPGVQMRTEQVGLRRTVGCGSQDVFRRLRIRVDRTLDGNLRLLPFRCRIPKSSVTLVEDSRQSGPYKIKNGLLTDTVTVSENQITQVWGHSSTTARQGALAIYFLLAGILTFGEGFLIGKLKGDI